MPEVHSDIRIMAISGSLRQKSSNTSLINALVHLAPPNVVIDVYDGLGELPHFNPDTDHDLLPESVAQFIARLRLADAVVICSPEYAHGVAGVMKNAIDWTVGSSGLAGKPIALVNASPRSKSAQAHLSETLRLLGNYVDDASIDVPVAGTGLGAHELAQDAELAPQIQGSLMALCAAVVDLGTDPEIA